MSADFISDVSLVALIRAASLFTVLVIGYHFYTFIGPVILNFLKIQEFKIPGYIKIYEEV